ncbi:MAG: lipoate--protein ligase family protein [Planctomycetes bacterium]|nr:lipoate--protein ligase family protein [Planctomycetota bacterium]
MLFLPLTLTSPAENLALDEALLLQAEDGGLEVLRLWEWQLPLVVLGAACPIASDVDRAACDRDGVPIMRRASGGGTVVLGRGCLCFSLVLSYDRDPALREVRSSYQFILGQVRDALSALVPGVTLAGTSDLAWGDRKFSGNSQQRKRRHLLHHGTILHDFDLTLSDRYLRMPSRQPDYRRQRPHAAFLTNLPVAVTTLHEQLREAWHAVETPPAWPEERVAHLLEARYSRTDWTVRR